MNRAPEVVVIGAGPAGLTAAHELVRRGKEVTLIEGAATVGGLTRSFDLWGTRVDLGPHRFFSPDQRVNAFWREMIGESYHMVDRITRILYRGKLFAYPLKGVETLIKLGPAEAIACLASYVRRKKKGDAPAESFEDWVVSRFGDRLFKAFFKTYSEKLWGVSCDRIDADFASQRIKGFSLKEALLHALPGRGRRHATLVDEFAYPCGGAGTVYENMASRFLEMGGDLRLETKVARVLTDSAEAKVSAVELMDGALIPCREVISTMPLDLLVGGLGSHHGFDQTQSDRLRFRNTVLVYLRVDGANLFPDNWIYVHAPELDVGRVTNYSNWGPPAPANATATTLSLEYWCDPDDEKWRADDAFWGELAEREIVATGLIGNSNVTDVHVERINRCYPRYERGYREALAPIEEKLRGIRGLHVIGRYGAFKYNNQDHSILMGMLAAENIVDGAGHDLWTVNTDYAQYQESERIDTCGIKDASGIAKGIGNKGLA